MANALLIIIIVLLVVLIGWMLFKNTNTQTEKFIDLKSIVPQNFIKYYQQMMPQGQQFINPNALTQPFIKPNLQTLTRPNLMGTNFVDPNYTYDVLQNVYGNPRNYPHYYLSQNLLKQFNPNKQLVQIQEVVPESVRQELKQELAQEMRQEMRQELAQEIRQELGEHMMKEKYTPTVSDIQSISNMVPGLTSTLSEGLAEYIPKFHKAFVNMTMSPAAVKTAEQFEHEMNMQLNRAESEAEQRMMYGGNGCSTCSTC